MRAENFSMEKIPTTYENKTAETEAVTKKALSIFDSNNDGKLDTKEVKAANEQIKTSGWQAIADKIAISVEQLKTFAETQLKTMGTEQRLKLPKPVENLDKSPHLPSKFHLENLKKKYPADKYDINYDKSNYLIEIKDKQGNLCLEIDGQNSHARLLEDGTLQSLPTIKEYENGQLIKATSYINQQVYLIEKDFDENENARYEKIHEYDKEGNLIKTRETIKEEDGLQKIIETEYDGNECYTKEYYNGRGIGMRLAENGINKKDIKRICAENVLEVFAGYERFNQNGNNLITNIVNNLEFSKKEKLDFIEHIGEQLIKVANSKGKDTRYIAEEFKIILEEQENEPIDATKLSNIIEKLHQFAKED